ncbi:hypothetical protein GCM10027277_57770 [Pseudoduganella ginsengisoli]|uniref:Protein kleE n=1 Tax=Pseudoduganella ginsengisoli TaxID=1462440 RepID=A0A6L6Q8T0_9BURK|nr:KleE stable inheritance protein [Pseudoduganella ginsengisoli]MTW05859.1 protein kleE [Pseudoduganella ginsengisoli]
MGLVFKFPEKPGAAARLEIIKPVIAPQVNTPTPLSGVSDMGIPESLIKHFINALWVITLLFWPVLRWIMALDVVFQAVRMAGVTFVAHFLIFAAVTYFATNYKPENY